MDINSGITLIVKVQQFEDRRVQAKASWNIKELKGKLSEIYDSVRTQKNENILSEIASFFTPSSCKNLTKIHKRTNPLKPITFSSILIFRERLIKMLISQKMSTVKSSNRKLFRKVF